MAETTPRGTERLLGAWALFACRRYKLVVGAAAVLTALSWIPPLTTGMTGGFDISRLLPQDVPEVRDFARALTDFDAIDEAVVVFRLGDGEERAGPPEKREPYVALAGRAADRLAATLRADPDFSGALSRVFTEEDAEYLWSDVLPEWGLLLASEDDLDEVERALAPESLDRTVARATRRIMGLGTDREELFRAVQIESLGLGGVFERAFKRFRPSSGEGTNLFGKPAPSWLVAKDNSMVLCVAQPNRPPQNAAFSRAVMAKIRDAARAAYEAEVPPAARPSVRMEFGGGYEIAIRYTTGVADALLNTGLTSLVGVILLFGVSYRRPGVLLYVGVPLAMVISWTLGAGWLLFGQVNLISCAFAAVLAALGVDYAIHIYNRYVEEKAAGFAVPESFRRAVLFTGRGVTMGMATTAFTFFVLRFTQFSQLAEFGLMAGLGIVLSLPTMCLVLPALVAWRDTGSGKDIVRRPPTTFGLPALARAVAARPRLCLLGMLAIFAGALAALAARPGSPGFDASLAKLRPPTPAFELGAEIARAFKGRNPNSLSLLAYADTELAAAELAALQEAGAARMERETIDGLPGLDSHQSVMTFLPSPEKQRRILARLQAIDWDAAVAAFREALDREGLSEEAFGLPLALLERHRDRVRAGAVVLPSTLRDGPLWQYVKRLVAERRRLVDLRQPLPDDLAFPVRLALPARDGRDRTVLPAGTLLKRDELVRLWENPDVPRPERVRRVTVARPGWVMKTTLYVPANPEKRRGGDPWLAPEWLAAARRNFLPAEAGGAAIVPAGATAVLTGQALVGHALATIVKADFLCISIVVFGVALGTMLLFFRREPARALWSLVPILLGVTYVLGFMTLFGLEFNYVNTLAVPILIGLGVDNGIHMVERFFESGRALRPTIADTGRAIVITALTSMVGFGSLALVGYSGIASLGWLTIYGLAAVGLSSLVALPAMLTLLYPETPKTVAVPDTVKTES